MTSVIKFCIRNKLSMVIYQDTKKVLYIYIYVREAVKAITLAKRNSFSREGINPRNILRLLRHFPLLAFYY